MYLITELKENILFVQNNCHFTFSQSPSLMERTSVTSQTFKFGKSWQITGKIAKKQKFCAPQRQTDVFMTCYLFVSSTYVQLLSTENYRCYTVYQYFDSSFFIILLQLTCSHTFSTLWQPCRLQISKRFL